MKAHKAYQHIKSENQGQSKELRTDENYLMILLNERQSLHFTINDLIIFKEEEIALSNEGTAQELRQIQVLIHQTLK